MILLGIVAEITKRLKKLVALVENVGLTAPVAYLNAYILESVPVNMEQQWRHDFSQLN